MRRGHIHVTQTCRQKSVITIKNKMNSIDNTKNKNDDYNNNKAIIVTIIIIKLIVTIIMITVSQNN